MADNQHEDRIQGLAANSPVGTTESSPARQCWVV
jgi:hypothetical protein